jgi:hypothetical protein
MGQSFVKLPEVHELIRQIVMAACFGRLMFSYQLHFSTLDPER